MDKKQKLMEIFTSISQAEMVETVRKLRDEDPKLEALFSQVDQFNKLYDGGLQQYINKAKHLLQKKTNPISLDSLFPLQNKKHFAVFDKDYISYQNMSKGSAISNPIIKRQWQCVCSDFRRRRRRSTRIRRNKTLDFCGSGKRRNVFGVLLGAFEALWTQNQDESDAGAHGVFQNRASDSRIN